jgi:hypothetical protein
VASLAVNTFPQVFLEVLHGWRNCCHFFPDVVSSPPLSLFLFVHLALDISPEEEIAGIEIGQSYRPFTRAGNISLRTLTAIPAVWAQTVWFQQDGAKDTIFQKWILQLKCFEIKLTLAINSLKKIVHFSFYYNLKIVRYFCRTLYVQHIHRSSTTNFYYYFIPIVNISMYIVF